MKLEIKSEKEVPLLSRKRVKLKAVFDKETPSRDKVRKEVSGMLKTKEELIVIKHIYPVFGRRESKVIANVYGNKEDMKRIEEEHLLKKHIKEEKKEEEKEEQGAPAGAAAPAAEAAESPAAEKTSPEPKAEEKNQEKNPGEKHE